MNRLTVVAISALGLLVIGCSGRSSSSSPTVAGPSPAAVARLADLVDFRGPAENTYRWSGWGTDGGQGTVIWRLNGDLSRWDTLTKAGASPTQGSFVVIKRANDVTQTFGCDWAAAAGDRSRVRADCGESGGGAPIMGGILGEALPLFADRSLTSAGARTVLGRRVPCYTGGGVQKICVDAQGRVLYFSYGTGSTAQAFEATSVIPAIEPFDWPFASLSSPTPISAELSAETLQFPGVFHLRR